MLHGRSDVWAPGRETRQGWRRHGDAWRRHWGRGRGLQGACCSQLLLSGVRGTVATAAVTQGGGSSRGEAHWKPGRTVAVGRACLRGSPSHSWAAGGGHHWKPGWAVRGRGIHWKPRGSVVCQEGWPVRQPESRPGGMVVRADTRDSKAQQPRLETQRGSAGGAAHWKPGGAVAVGRAGLGGSPIRDLAWSAAGVRGSRSWGTGPCGACMT
eukprot:COSAG01_NODE_3793_length_5690_cov_6.048650_5_plen_211_part_00